MLKRAVIGTAVGWAAPQIVSTEPAWAMTCCPRTVTVPFQVQVVTSCGVQTQGPAGGTACYREIRGTVTGFCLPRTATKVYLSLTATGGDPGYDDGMYAVITPSGGASTTLAWNTYGTQCVPPGVTSVRKPVVPGGCGAANNGSPGYDVTASFRPCVSYTVSIGAFNQMNGSVNNLTWTNVFLRVT